MNFRDKKTQYAIITSLVGVIIFFLILLLVILPAMRSWKEDFNKTAEIQKTLAEMRQVVQSREAIQCQIETTRAEIRKMAKHIPIPALGNYLLGMEEQLRICSTNSGVNVMNIADNDMLDLSTEGKTFKVYRVRAQARAGFGDYIRLVEAIHNSNPLASISGFNIVARDDTPQFHEMSFIVSWLVWSEPDNRPSFLISEK